MYGPTASPIANPTPVASTIGMAATKVAPKDPIPANIVGTNELNPVVIPLINVPLAPDIVPNRVRNFVAPSPNNPTNLPKPVFAPPRTLDSPPPATLTNFAVVYSVPAVINMLPSICPAPDNNPNTGSAISGLKYSSHVSLPYRMIFSVVDNTISSAPSPVVLLLACKSTYEFLRCSPNTSWIFNAFPNC